LITWNIDMKARYGTLRMRRALLYLDRGVLKTLPLLEPVKIFFQEMTVEDIAVIRGTVLVRERFYMTDIDIRRWSNSLYGTVMLIDKRLVVSGGCQSGGRWKAFRVSYESRCGRDGLFVDITLSPLPSQSQLPTKFLRLCNTHLESYGTNAPVRQLQMETVVKFLQGLPHGSLLTGDLNAVDPLDATFPSTYNLSDAYLCLGGKEGVEDGFTWGYQSPARVLEKHGYSRMDKVLFCGDVKVWCLERIGIGLDIGNELWITDHYGLHTRVEVISGWGLKMVIR
ncbi:hypothetical protein AOQ84DRAFT_287793, partial [Glonium stellatum]